MITIITHLIATKPSIIQGFIINSVDVTVFAFDGRALNFFPISVAYSEAGVVFDFDGISRGCEAGVDALIVAGAAAEAVCVGVGWGGEEGEDGCNKG